MIEKDEDLSNGMIDINEFPDKTNDEIKKNAIRFEINLGNNNIIFGSGFLCKIYINDNINYPMPVLITCYHLLKENYLEDHDTLYFSYFLGEEKKKVSLYLSIKRIIYFDKELDVTIIEIKLEDKNLDIYSFLEMDQEINVNNPILKNREIYLLHYPKGVQDIIFSKGRINDLIDNTNFIANYDSEPGSSGSPVIDYEKKKVIGIHRGSFGSDDEKVGFGIILKYVIKEFSEEKKEEIEETYKNLYTYLDTMDMIYIIPKDKNIKLFSEEFVKRYEGFCQIIYNNLEYSLRQYFKTSYLTKEDINKGEFRITLKGIKYAKNMRFMFSRCHLLKKLNAVRTDFSNVVNMEHMFEWCENLEDVSDTSYWNLENVITLKALFYKCTKLKKIQGIEKWNPIKIKTCEEMFLGCYKSLPLSETSKIYEWKNVPEKIKVKGAKGYSATNYVSYAFGENLGGTLKYVSDNMPFLKKKKSKKNK
jgi:hypothetical protein